MVQVLQAAEKDAPKSRKQAFASSVYDDVAAVVLPGVAMASAQFGQLQTKPMTEERLFYVLLIFPTEIHAASRVNDVLVSCRCCQNR